MKPALFAPYLGAAFAFAPLAPASPLSFDTTDLAAPTLSLRESIANGDLLSEAPVVKRDHHRDRSLTRPRSGLGRQGPGRMPIIEPDPTIDFSMIVKTPDESVDYKMIVRDMRGHAVSRR